MKRKIVGIVICSLLITSSIILVKDNGDVKASDGGGGGDNSAPFDYDFIWTMVHNFSRVVYDADWTGEEHDISKGRCWATAGEEYTINEILIPHMSNQLECNLSGVKKLPLGYIDEDPYKDNGYTNKVVPDNFQLQINNPSYPYSTSIPKTEMFVFPSGCKYYYFPWTSTYNYTYDETEILPKNMNETWPAGGTFTDSYLNTSCFLSDNVEGSFDSVNFMEEIIVGNVTFLNKTQNVPSDQECNVFMFNEESGCERKLENITNATGVILINQGRSYTVSNTTLVNISCQVVRINENENNLTQIKELLENETPMFVDNVVNHSVLTFTCDLDDGLWPLIDFVYIDRIPTPYEQNIVEYWGNIVVKTILFHIINKVRFVACTALVLYDSYDTHFMFPTNRDWDLAFGVNSPALPIFSVNNSVGSWVENHYQDTTISGFLDQKYYRQTRWDPGVSSYNVVGYRDSPNNNEMVIVQNRFDGWWSEAPGDSGCGGATVLGIAKYFNDNHITPKCNLTFLFTTGEEYGYRGGYHYMHSNDDDPVTTFIALDQIAFNQKDCNLSISYNDETMRNVVTEIANAMNYDERVENLGYPPLYHGIVNGTSGGEDIVWRNHPKREVNALCFAKDPFRKWYRYHRAGMNYGEGDSMNYIDRDDLNLTSELAWSVVKYYSVNPDCWFKSVTYESVDSNGGTIMDSLKASINVKSVLPNDLVMIKANLVDVLSENIVNTTWVNYTTNRAGVEQNITLGMPNSVNEGDYYLTLEVYNSTGRINQIVGLDYSANDTSTSPTYHLNQYHTVGDIRIGTVSSNVENIILASRFTVTEDAYAQNMTAYVYGATLYPPQPRQTYQCMIYRASDLQLIGSTGRVVCGDTGWVTFPFDQKPLLIKNTQYFLSIWGENTTSVYGTSQSIANGYHNNSCTFGDPPETIVWDMGISMRQYSIFCNYLLEPYPPEITNVSNIPETAGFGEDVTIEADVMDNLSGVDYVKVNITYPDDSYGNYTMSHLSGDQFQYMFNDTWLVGQYNYTIWAYDNSNNGNSSTGHHFRVSANATITVQTLQDTYYSGDYVNLTDPPGDGGETTVDYFGDINVPESLHLIVTEDANMITVDTRDGLVWKFNKGTNGYDEIWHNGTRLIDEEQWILQNLQHEEWMPCGTSQQIIVEQPEPYHAIVKRMYSNQAGTDFAVSYEFYGQSRTKIKFEGNIGEINNYRLIWSATGINTDFAERNTNDHYTRIWNTGEQGFVFDYSDVYRTLGDITSVESQMTQYGYTVDQTFNLGILAPGYYTLDPTFGYTTQGGSGLSIGNSIRGSWFTCPSDGVATNIKAYITHTGLGGGSTNGKCAIYRYQADNDATDLIGETNQISLSGTGWRTFSFTNGPTLTAGTKYFLVAWASTQTLIVDTLAYTTETAKGIAKTSTTYGSWPDPLTGETGVDHKYSIYCMYNASPVISTPYPANGSGNISRYPTMHVYVNDSEGDDMNITFSSNVSGPWDEFGEIKLGTGNTFGYPQSSSNSESIDDVIRGTWFTCPANGTAYRVWVYTLFYDTIPPNQHMKAALYYKSNNTLVASGDIIPVTPGESPAWARCTFSPCPSLVAGEEYYILVWGQNIDAYYRYLPDSNRSIFINNTYGGAWPNTLYNINYSTGKVYDIYVQYNTTSTPNGTYYMDNFDMNNAFTRYYWNVSATDGESTTNSGIYYFRTSGNQSKINNTGTTNITGYLLMQVQFYNSTLSAWVVVDDTINETAPRTILVGGYLKLDTIFNGLVPTSDLLTEFGYGTYRVYAAFRDPNGNVLVCTDETELETTWEFTITSS